MTSGDGSILRQLRRTLRADVLDCAPDDELLEQFVGQRDEAAFAALVRRHGPMVWGVCQRVLLHRQDTEDAFQATFLVLASKAGFITRRKLLANWLFGVARRAALNMRAMRARRARREQLCADPPDTPMMLEPSPNDARAVLDEELARMPAKYRLPLLLCSLEGMTHVEAGKHLGWPTGTVAGRLSRAKELLRSRLLRRGVTATAALLTSALAPDAAPAALPPQLVAASVRSAALIVCGKSAAVAVSPTAATLTRSLLTNMFLARIWATTAVTAALAIGLGGAGAMWHFTMPAKLPLSPPPTLAATPISPAAPDTAPTGGPAIRLPSDANAVVLRMDRSVDSGPSMALTVYADGRVVAEIPDGLASLSATELTRYAKTRTSAGNAAPLRTKKIEGKISIRELQELVRFAIQEQEFFDFDPDAVRADIRDKYKSDGNVFDSTDATTTGFHIQTADKKHEVRWFRLAKAGWDFPKVERLLQLYAWDRQLSRLFWVLLAGGPERVDAVVAKMNELVLPFYRLYPEVPTLTAADLFMVTPFADGSGMRFTFSRNKDKLVRNPLFEVSIDVPERGEPAIVYVIPPGKRFRGRVLELIPLVPS
jgi:RNA polymerase sigma factor (sigma-70 family)